MALVNSIIIKTKKEINFFDKKKPYYYAGNNNMASKMNVSVVTGCTYGGSRRLSRYTHGQSQFEK
jgi:hypothetical protein